MLGLSVRHPFPTHTLIKTIFKKKKKNTHTQGIAGFSSFGRHPAPLHQIENQ